MARSAGAERANWPVVAGARVGPESIGGVTAELSTVPWISSSHRE
ncbi:MAG TPA: hypothetical protein VGR06_25965 [Actinophytocola sp.]|nr:hypothetical protein [Actinophytocola sp.]